MNHNGLIAIFLGYLVVIVGVVIIVMINFVKKGIPLFFIGNYFDHFFSGKLNRNTFEVTKSLERQRYLIYNGKENIIVKTLLQTLNRARPVRKAEYCERNGL